MRENPLISIIIPVYNSEATLSLCLDSIIKQSYDNIETIVVESRKSSDRSIEIAEKYDCRIFTLNDKERILLLLIMESGSLKENIFIE